MLAHLQVSNIALIVLLCLTAYSLVRYLLRSSLQLPPGPPAKLLSGNVHQIPHTLPWQTYAKWSKTYGPIFSYRIYRTHFVVINTAKVAIDLLESRSSIYSDRPMDRWMYLELVNRKLAVFNISTRNPRFKEYRRILNTGLNARATKSYHIILEEERLRLLRALTAAPADLITHLRGNAGAIILKIAYGWTVQDTQNDPFIKLVHEAFYKHAGLVKPGSWMVDSFPLLRFVPAWFPGAGFQRSAKEYRKRMAHIDDIPHQWAKDQMATGNYIPSFTSLHLCREDGTIADTEQEDIIKWCSSALYIGGADTTTSILMAFFLLMILNPQMQTRAQDEIDRIVGKSRLPNIKDKDNLPYINALLKEVLRWAPAAPLALPHRLTQDDTYAGFFIPRNATIIPNIWAIMHDEEMYPNPETFNPERFLSTNPEPDPRKWVFGFGRRVCPGAHFAEVSLILNIASILAVFSISPAVDDRGNEIKPQIEFTTGVTSHAEPFAYRIVPRFNDAETLLNTGGD